MIHFHIEIVFINMIKDAAKSWPIWPTRAKVRWLFMSWNFLRYGGLMLRWFLFLGKLFPLACGQTG